MKFIPYTSLLNNIYTPFYEAPKKIILNGNDITLEEDAAGARSIIYLNKDDKSYIPFIDIRKFDLESKDWYFYEHLTDYPYRFKANADNTWSISNLYVDGLLDESYKTEDKNIPLFFDKVTSSIYTEINSYRDGIVKLNKGVPIVVAVENFPLNDITDYSSAVSSSTLNKIDTSVNREFYYDFQQNRIVTNQNLAGISPSDIIVSFYSTTNEIQIKCRLSTNEADVSDITPVVDYFIVKLNGQDIRG